MSDPRLLLLLLRLRTLQMPERILPLAEFEESVEVAWKLRGS
jgi:hypothetical protein